MDGRYPQHRPSTLFTPPAGYWNPQSGGLWVPETADYDANSNMIQQYEQSFPQTEHYDQNNYELNAEDEDENELVPEDGDIYEIRGRIEDHLLQEQAAVTSLSFDNTEELLWVGWENGRLISYLCPNMDKYTSVFAFDKPVQQLLTAYYGVVTISEDRIKQYSRGGLCNFSYSNANMQNLHCMVFPSQYTAETIIIGGGTHMFIFDINGSRLLKEHQLGFGTICLQRTDKHQIVCGHTSGMITLRDPNTFATEHTFQAHTGGVTGIDVKGDLLVTCGWSKRMDSAFVDPFVKTYDLRMLRSDVPISFPNGPYRCKFHPTLESTLVMMSQTGQYQIYDMKAGDGAYYQVNTASVVTDFDISTSGEMLVFGDASGYLSMWAPGEACKVNVQSEPTEIVDLEPPPPKIKMDENTPLNTIILPQEMHTNQLLSYWNLNMSFPVTPPPKNIDTQLFPDFRQVDFVGYATNPGLKRNQASAYYSRTAAGSPARKLDILLQNKPKKEDRPPRAYRHKEIKITKLGVEGFDFSMYNQTQFGGLENTIPNSYCNSVLQTLYFIPQLRASMLNHLCRKEFCLSCELGFLFHMLDHAKGANCQASNVLRSFRQIPQASGLGLTETPADDQVSLVRLMETFNRFILEQLQKESSNKHVFQNPHHPYHQYFLEHPQPQIIDQLFGSTSVSHSKCMSCKHETTRETRSFQYDMLYPEQQASRKSLDSFASILKTSLLRENHTKAWCNVCSRYQLTEQKRALTSLPNILCINTAASKADLEFWKSKYDDQNLESSWLPLKIRLKINPELSIQALDPSHQEPATEDENEAIYELTAMISHVYDPSKKASKHSHLVAEIRVPSHYALPEGSDHTWYLFNDFYITSVPVNIVADFSFKSPCVLHYTRVDIDKRLPIMPILNPITEEVLFDDNPIKPYGLRSNTHKDPLSFIPVNKQTVPKEGDLIAMDAEFVSLGAEETEIRSDGTRVVLNPCHFSLARVSVLRGQPPSVGEPFIDDYIVTSEPVVDYLTRYSGIEPGDLDPKVSKHHVTTLKAAYLKLRYLIDKGCKIIGHGVAKDFRILNVLVPQEQVIDTVELFNLPSQRKIALRFLASCLLNVDIQSETHDSIEDAKTALMLYQKYLELKQNNTFEQTLLQIYEVGRKTKWTVPPEGALLPKLP